MFDVLCLSAQAAGLLCEEAGNNMDNVCALDLVVYYLLMTLILKIRLNTVVIVVITTRSS